MLLLIRWLVRRFRARKGTEASAVQLEGPVGLVLHQARYDLLGFLRNRQARFFTLVLPLLFLVIFVSVFGNDDVSGVKASTYYVPGISALAIIAASFVNLVISITAQRESGILKRRRATPVPAWALIAARTLTAMSVSLVVMTIVLAVGRFAYGVRLPTSTIPGVALTALVGSATFCILGYALTTFVHSEDAAQPMTQAVMLPLYFISGVFVPNVNLPGWLRHVARFFPVEHLAHGLHNAFDPAVHGVGIVWSDLAVLAAWGVVGLVVALRRFSWTPAVAAAA
jgi:ABC-2 type transport system permease protein